MITMLPLDSVRPVTKSRVIWDQGRHGMDSCTRKPAGGWCNNFLGAQVGQAAMNLLASRVMNGHQNRW